MGAPHHAGARDLPHAQSAAGGSVSRPHRHAVPRRRRNSSFLRSLGPDQGGAAPQRLPHRRMLARHARLALGAARDRALPGDGEGRPHPAAADRGRAGGVVSARAAPATGGQSRSGRHGRAGLGGDRADCRRCAAAQRRAPLEDRASRAVAIVLGAAGLPLRRPSAARRRAAQRPVAGAHRRRARGGRGRRRRWAVVVGCESAHQDRALRQCRRALGRAGLRRPARGRGLAPARRQLPPHQPARTGARARPHQRFGRAARRFGHRARGGGLERRRCALGLRLSRRWPRRRRDLGLSGCVRSDRRADAQHRAPIRA
jgi:hypothetical protein